MDESGNRYILKRPAEILPVLPESAELPDAEEHYKRQLSIIELFGTIDFNPGDDVKAKRRLDDKWIPKDMGE
jgi:hypothetical protein